MIVSKKQLPSPLPIPLVHVEEDPVLNMPPLPRAGVPANGWIRRAIDRNPASAAVLLGASHLVQLGAPIHASADNFDDYVQARGALTELPSALIAPMLRPVTDRAYEVVDHIPAPIRRPFDRALGVLLDNLSALGTQAMTSRLGIDSGPLPQSSNVHIKPYPQIKNSCGETMLATWLKGRGVPIATGEVDTQIPFFSGSSGLIDVELKKRGFSLISGPGSFEDLRTYLAHGYPVMVSVGWANGGGHYALVTGYDDATKTLTIDGYRADGKIAKVSYEQFLGDWKRHANSMTVAHPHRDIRLKALRDEGRLSRYAEIQEGVSISEIWLTEQRRLFMEVAYRHRSVKHDLTIRLNVNTSQKHLGPAGMLGGSLDYIQNINPGTRFHLHMERLTIKGEAPKAIKDIIAKSAIYAGIEHRNISARLGYERGAFQASFQASVEKQLARVGFDARVDVTLEGDVRVFVGLSGTF